MWPCVICDVCIRAQIRTFTPCPGDGDCNWVETDVPLVEGRWYASNAQLPDGTQIVVGGRNNPTVEFVPANGRGATYVPLIGNVIITTPFWSHHAWSRVPAPPQTSCAWERNIDISQPTVDMIMSRNLRLSEREKFEMICNLRQARSSVISSDSFRNWLVEFRYLIGGCASLQANDGQADNLYPYVHLLPNDQIFLFANQYAVLFDWKTVTAVKQLPNLPGGPRNYPSAGSSVLLPLSAYIDYTLPEVVVCGGATYGAFLNPGAALPATASCGRIAPLTEGANWQMENMPLRRNMGDMVLLPDRTVLIINGAANGAQGWGNAQNPVLTPVLYNPNGAVGRRFQVLTGTNIARVYHSTANLLPDGRVLIAGSNTHQFYTLTGYLATELRIEAYSPAYLRGNRPVIANAPEELAYNARFEARVENGNPRAIELNLVSAAYSTHSFGQVLTTDWPSCSTRRAILSPRLKHGAMSLDWNG